MDRLNWVERPDGWRSGRYRVELVAPSLWVVSREGRSAARRAGMVPASIEVTTGSLRAAKRAAEAMEARRRERRRIRRHLAFLALAGLAVTGVGTLAETWTVPLVSLLSVFSVRSVLLVSDALIGRPHERVKETYQ